MPSPPERSPIAASLSGLAALRRCGRAALDGLLMSAVALVGACGADEAPSGEAAATIEIPDAVGEAVPDGVDDGAAGAGESPPETAPATGTARAAAAIVRDYFDRLRGGDPSAARLLWEGDAAGEAALAARIASYGGFDADIGEPGAIEAGAGQRYIDVPFRVSGDAPGAPAPVRGRLTLHRVAKIDGASARQQRWQIRSVAFGERPASSPSPSPTVATARYRCIDGTRLVADFDNDAGTVTLTRDGAPLGVLARQPAASGIWYRAQGYELRGEGDAATFSAPDLPPMACTAG